MSEHIRQQAVDPAASFLVQAPAGSGKTELLTRRILKLLTVVDEPEEILALTFTRKAAAEMRDRVIEALMMAKPDVSAPHKMETWLLAQQASRRSEEQGWRLVEHPSRLNMMTLDSFTHALARQLPMLSGFGEMPSPSTHVLPLYREAAEQAVAALVRREPERAAAVLLHQDHNMVSLIELVADMLGKRDQWLRDVRIHTSNPAALRAMLEQTLVEIMQQQLNQCAGLIPIEARCELPALLHFAGKNIGDAELQEIMAWPDAAIEQLALWQRIADVLLTQDKNSPAFRKSADKRIGFPAGKEFAAQKQHFLHILSLLADIDGLADAFNTLRKLPVEPRFDASQWQVLEAQLQLLLLASHQLQQLFEQRGEADFIEIAMRALHALEDEQGHPTDLLLRLDYRIRHILVDEFQDTSLLQLRLLQSLTEGWQSGDGTHRTLFMVGDPMQSIYRFRKAEVSLFLLAAANKAGLPQVSALELERNFRSSPVIVDWVNRAFANIFPKEPDYLLAAVGHARADAALLHAGSVQLHLQQQPDADNEAQAIVATVRQALAKPDQEIAILSRSRKHLHAIMQSLAEAQIAFRAIDILPLHERPEIRLLRALLRALLHPADRESWAALLRAPCCGIDTVSMHRLLAGDARPIAAILVDEEKLQRLDNDAQARVRFLARALQPCLQSAGRMPVRPLLNTAWQRLGLTGLSGDARNIEAMLNLIEEIDAGGLIDFALLDERLQKLYASPDTSSDAARVELLTMHGAKGLQWDVVILPGLGHGKGRSDTPLLAFTDVPVPGGTQPLVAVRGAVRSGDAIYDLVRNVEKIRERNELARLLYVACTRAETELHMYGHLPERSDTPSKGSLLELLLPKGMDGGCFDADIHLLAQTESATGSSQAQLTRFKSIPATAELPESSGLQVAESESEYFWAGPEAAPIGNAVHAALQQIADKGVEQWLAEDTTAAVARMRSMLLRDGLHGKLLATALQRCRLGLEQVLGSERARWILSGQHQDAHAEWALSTGRSDQVHHFILDRSFVDHEGNRWIIDYKTGMHEGAATGEFMDSELQRYAPQLLQYAAVVRGLDTRPIRMALYFPMLDGWRELQSPTVMEGDS